MDINEDAWRSRSVSIRKQSLTITSGFSRGLSSMGGRSGAAARGSRSSCTPGPRTSRAGRVRFELIDAGDDRVVGLTHQSATEKGAACRSS